MRPEQPNAMGDCGGARKFQARALGHPSPAFGQRAFPPPFFIPLPPENPFWDRIEPHIGRLKSDAARAFALLTAALGRLRAGAFRPHIVRRADNRAPLHPALRTLAQEGRETLVRFIAYVAGIGALSFFAAQIFQPPMVAAAIEPAPRPDWITVGKSYPAFLLTLPVFGEATRYAIHRHLEGGGRKDVMTFGEPGRSLRYAMVEIYRPGAESDGFADAASEIAARAADLGPAGAVKPSLPIDTKFGTADSVEFRVGRFGIGHCIGFVRAFDQPRLQIAGISCSMDSLVDRNAVACVLDRLTLMSAGSDPEIAKLFAQAEIKRTFCGRRDPLLYATPKREYPLRATPLRLRGRLSAR